MNPLNRAKLILYLVSIFLAGGISGAFVGYTLRGDHPGFGPRPTREQMIQWVHEKLSSQVGISEEQWQQILPIVTNTVQSVSDLDERNRERIGELIAQSDAAILQKLTPEQQPRWNQLIEERQKFHQEHRASKGAAKGASKGAAK